MSDFEQGAFPANDFEMPRRKGTLAVILGGVATSFLALAGVWLLGQTVDDFNIMGWYAMLIVPAGAMVVGMAAGLGYCLVSWWRGVKITGVLLWSVLALQALSYVEAQYVEYRMVQPVFQDGTPMSFSTYFDLTTRSMTFSKRGGKGEGPPLGGWGYAFRVLELIGFALGGLVPSLLLLAKPYCETCQVYMKTRSQGLLPAGVVPRKIKKNDPAAQQAYEAELQQAMESGLSHVRTAFEHAAAGNAAAFRALLAQHKPQQKEIQKQSTRTDVQLNYCPRCSSGTLRAICTSGQGEETTQQEIQTQSVEPQFVQDCLRLV